jgi:transcriptional regulator with XRE-family HTH domain
MLEVSHQLREALRRRDDLARKAGKRYTRSDAADELNVSRSSLQFYLAGNHMPSTDVLRRAMELWGIELTYRGRKLAVVDLQTPLQLKQPIPSQPVQLSLWE